ncbi:MAG: ABC-2 family transporter protein [Lachnospiraceae bacterium]|jgi:ABC-2 type transport system permease protein|nr:ABC-2 family transporter protein [Lachnospiraceae bacterium]
MQYRLSLWLTTIGQFFVSFFAFLGMYLLFEQFGSIAGWNFGEAALMFAVVLIAFSITECYARGFDVFSRFIKSGDFDRILLRPRSTVLQILGSNFEISRLGRLVESVVVLWIAITLLDIPWTISKVITLILMILSGIFIFTGIFILGATVCFFTVEGLEFINIFTDGGREIAQYPLTIYPKWVMRFFTFIIPFGSFNYLPLLYLTGRATENVTLYMLSPLLGVVFLIPCLFIWKFGVKRYLSTGN